MTIDVQEFAPLGHGAVPVSFMGEEVFEMVDFAERYQARIAVRVTTFEEPFLFLLLTAQEHRLFSFKLGFKLGFKLVSSFIKQLAESFENRLTIKNLFRSFFALSKNKNTISQIRVLSAARFRDTSWLCRKTSPPRVPSVAHGL